MTDWSQVNSKGQLLGDEHINEKTSQFMTVASDGQCLIWDIRYQVRCGNKGGWVEWVNCSLTSLRYCVLSYGVPTFIRIPDQSGKSIDFSDTLLRTFVASRLKARLSTYRTPHISYNRSSSTSRGSCTHLPPNPMLVVLFSKPAFLSRGGAIGGRKK